MRFTKTLVQGSALSAGLLLGSTALADDLYLSGSLGLSNQQSTSNNGRFFEPFTTGVVTGVDPALTIPAGEGIGWRTSYDRGRYHSITLGWDIDILRVEMEYSRSGSDVDRHRGVSAAGIDLSGIDAGVLISENVGDLGTSVADLVAVDSGEINSKAVMLNFIYDFDLGAPIIPYAGIGVGLTDTDVTFRPSNEEVINSDDKTFMYQFILGATYEVNETFDVFANYRYRASNDLSVTATMLPARFSINNEAHIFDLGLRVKF